MPHEDILGAGFFTAVTMYPGWRRLASETANADRLVERFADEIRYCSDRQVWCAWNGKLWVVNDIGAIMRRMEEVVRSIYIEVSEIKEDDERKKMTAWAITSESRRSQENSIALARWKRGIEVRAFADLFDTSPLLLNASNGTIDLSTGELRSFHREDYLTKNIPFEYFPLADCPKFKQFLSEALPLEGMQEYMQRFAGYCLTGMVSEQAWFMFYGVTGSGKSTLINILRGLLGPYATTLPEDYLLDIKDKTDYTTASLPGIRLATCVETNQGKRLNVSKIKSLTGGDMVSAALKYQNQFEFKPTAKLLLATNHRPRVPDTDDSIWRRMFIVPFNIAVPEDRKMDNFSDYLLSEEGPGILRWAVEGARKWLTEHLSPPQAMRIAREEYRNEEDTVREFVSEYYTSVNDDARTLKKDMYAFYVAKQKESGFKFHLSRKRFGMEMVRLEYQQSSDERYWLGLEPRSEI